MFQVALRSYTRKTQKGRNVKLADSVSACDKDNKVYSPSSRMSALVPRSSISHSSHIPHRTSQSNYPAPVSLPHWTPSTVPTCHRPQWSPLEDISEMTAVKVKEKLELPNRKAQPMIPDARLEAFARSHWDSRQILDRMSDEGGFEGFLTILLPMCIFGKLSCCGWNMTCLP